MTLHCDDRVKLQNLNSEILDGRQGTVIGWNVDHIINFYIVLLDDPVEAGEFIHKAVSIPEPCLKRIS